MNFALSDEQEMVREAARSALTPLGTVEAARAALEGRRADLWSVTQQAGWSGLLFSEEAGGAGLGGTEAMLVALECGRALADAGLQGHVSAAALITPDAIEGSVLAGLVDGDLRAAYLPARPPCSLQRDWSADPRRGSRRSLPIRLHGNDRSVLASGSAHWVPDAPGADVLVSVGQAAEGVRAFLVRSDAEGVSTQTVTSYDASRSLGHVDLDSAEVQVLDVDPDLHSRSWYLAGALLGADSLGTAEEALERSVAYAKERTTFGRSIGSYQAVKHQLVEGLRLIESARSLMYWAGLAYDQAPERLALAASAARHAAGKALDFVSREYISVHGGIGATWEHDAPLFFRRAQVNRRLLGGARDAAERVADQLIRSSSRL